MIKLMVQWTLGGLLVLAGMHSAWAPDQRADLGYGFASNLVSREAAPADLCASPWVLNGQLLSSGTVSYTANGKLELVGGNPTLADSPRLPYRIYLQRNGTVLNEGASCPDRTVTEIELSTVLKLARPGDELMIEPVRPQDVRGKRLLKVVRHYDWMLRSLENC